MHLCHFYQLYDSTEKQIRVYLGSDLNTREERNALLGDPRFNFAWTGEYCICTGKDTFSGFGLREGNTIEFSSDAIRRTLLQRAINLYDLAKDRVKSMSKRIKELNIRPPSFDNVILYDLCYRVNTDEIMKKM